MGTTTVVWFLTPKYSFVTTLLQQLYMQYITNWQFSEYPTLITPPPPLSLSRVSKDVDKVHPAAAGQ